MCDVIRNFMLDQKKKVISDLLCVFNGQGLFYLHDFVLICMNFEIYFFPLRQQQQQQKSVIFGLYWKWKLFLTLEWNNLATLFSPLIPSKPLILDSKNIYSCQHFFSRSFVRYFMLARMWTIQSMLYDWIVYCRLI